MLAGIGAAVGIAGSLFSGISGYRSGKKAAKLAKRIGGMRSKELLRQAGQEEEYNQDEQKALLEAQARRTSTINSMYAKSGLLLTGTPATAMQEQKEADKYNFGQIADVGSERVRALRESAKLEKLQAGASAGAYETQGRTALIGGLFGAAGGALDFMGGWLGKGGKTPPAKTNPWNQISGFY